MAKKADKRQARPANAITCEAASKLLSIQPNNLVRYCRQGMRNWRKGVLCYVLPEDVREWRSTHEKASTLARGSFPDDACAPLSTDPVDASTPMARLLQIESAAFKDYQLARESRKIDAVRASMSTYGQISKVLSEALRREERLTEQRVEWWGECSQVINQWADNARSLLDSMPRSVAPFANPGDPAAAEAALVKYRNETLLPGLATPARLKQNKGEPPASKEITTIEPQLDKQ